MKAVISAGTLKKIMKIDEFLWSRFSTEDGREKSNISSTFFCITSGKVKMQLKCFQDFVCREGAVTDQICKKWFTKFCIRKSLLDDAPESGRSVEVDSNQIETLIENNQYYSMQKTADILKISKSNVEKYLHQLGYFNHFDVWVPPKLNRKILASFLHVILYWNITECSIFKTNCDGQ